jgi:predicted nucleic-acid-binding Zn-ribbon protein
MADQYPPFSGDEPTCAKCGREGDTFTQYRERGQCIHGHSLEEVVGWEPNERLHRECARCSYEWDEAIVDSGRAASGE